MEEVLPADPPSLVVSPTDSDLSPTVFCRSEEYTLNFLNQRVMATRPISLTAFCSSSLIAFWQSFRLQWSSTSFRSGNMVLHCIRFSFLPVLLPSDPKAIQRLWILLCRLFTDSNSGMAWFFHKSQNFICFPFRVIWLSSVCRLYNNLAFSRCIHDIFISFLYNIRHVYL